MVNERRYRDQAKVLKVIASCQTFDQLRVVSNMIYAYNETYNTYAEVLDDMYFSRLFKLGTGQNK